MGEDTQPCLPELGLAKFLIPRMRKSGRPDFVTGLGEVGEGVTCAWRILPLTTPGLDPGVD